MTMPNIAKTNKVMMVAGTPCPSINQRSNPPTHSAKQRIVEINIAAKYAHNAA